MKFFLFIKNIKMRKKKISILKSRKSFKKTYDEMMNCKDEIKKNEFLLKIFPFINQYNHALSINDNDLVDKFENKLDKLLNESGEYIYEDIDMCKKCNVYFNEVRDEDYCPSCGIVSNNLKFVITQKEINRTGYTITSKVSYDKINHLNNLLKRFQSQEHKQIPENVMHDIVEELKKRRITDFSKLNIKNIKEILKKLKYNIYYNNSISILNKLNNRTNFIISHELNEKINKMFLKIEEPWLKYKNDNRKNNLSFYYVLHKFFQILELDDYMEFFPLLKSHERLRQHDVVFKKIIEDLQKTDTEFKWFFKPSL